MTFYELTVFIRGRNEAEHAQMRQLAWHASTLLHAWVKNAPSPGELLGEEIDAAKCLSAEEFARKVRALRERRVG